MNVYCINLDKRDDNWAHIKEESKKITPNIIRFPAILRKRGHDGCKESHMTLLKRIRDEGQMEFMVIEDDMIMCVDNPMEAIWRAYAQLPHDWDMFYLGATLTQPLYRYSANLLRLKQAWATHAIIYNNQNGVVDYILDNHNESKFSVFLGRAVQDNFKCYISYPLIATQKEGYSDILNKRVDYKVIQKNYDKYTK